MNYNLPAPFQERTKLQLTHPCRNGQTELENIRSQVAALEGGRIS